MTTGCITKNRSVTVEGAVTLGIGDSEREQRRTLGNRKLECVIVDGDIDGDSLFFVFSSVTVNIGAGAKK